MRWPLRFQILLPMLVLLFATVAVLTGLSFYSASRSHQQRLETDLRDVSEYLTSTTFPLTGTILRDMKTLSGADFVLLSDDKVMATTFPFELEPKTLVELAELKSADPDADSLRQVIRINDATYYHRQAMTANQKWDRNRQSLHLLFEEDSYQQLWWENVWPSILVGLIALPVVALVATWLALAVTRPLSRLQTQVEQVADGQLTPLDLGDRNDEIRDLSEAVNRMALQLKAYEDEIRKKERAETLVDLGSGIAHHLRNSATGCRMAIQLSQISGNLNEETKENLRVALRQLALMDKYIQRFLSLDARSPSGRSDGPIAWVSLCREVLDLLGPSAKHLGVELLQDLPGEEFHVQVPVDDLEQVMMNLVTNALDAAAEHASQTKDPERKKPIVAVEFEIENTFATLRVYDSGCGPPAEISDSLFQSFVTRKRNGVGLGLYLTKQIVDRHGGSVQWRRTLDQRTNEQRTCFEVRLPGVTSNSSTESSPVDSAESI